MNVLGSFASILGSGRLRARRAVFWYLGPERIVAAVLARSDREPVLEACAASYAAPLGGSVFASGLLEVAWVLGCQREVHVAALASSLCRVVADPGADGAGATPDPAFEAAGATGTVSCEAAVRGADGLRAVSRAAVVSEAAGLFRRARLRLLALDCEDCALASLAEALGTADEEGARRQHLSAVAVLPESVGTAEALGPDLAVPVGLAVAWFGAERAL